MSNPVTNISFENMEMLAEGDTDFLVDLYQEIIKQFQEAKTNYVATLPSLNVDELRKIAHKVTPNLQSLEVDGLPDIFASVKERLMNGETLSADEVTQIQEQINNGFNYCIDKIEAKITEMT